MADEEPSLSDTTTDGRTSFSTRLLSISKRPSRRYPDHRRVFVEEIVDRLAQAALRQQTRVGAQFQNPPWPSWRATRPGPAFCRRSALRSSGDSCPASHPQCGGRSCRIWPDEPDGLGARLLRRLIPLAPNVSQAPQALEGPGSLPPQRIVDGIGVGLNRALKIGQAFLRTFPTPAPAELQEHIALGVGVKPQVTGGRFAFDLRIQSALTGRLINLQVAGPRLSVPPKCQHVINGQQPKGAIFSTHCTICWRATTTPYRSRKFCSSL